jgi:signal peptidase I
MPEWGKSLMKAVFLLALFFGYRSYVVTWTGMLSGSMAPTLCATRHTRDVVLVDTLTLRTRLPKRGEIVHLYVKNPEKTWNYVFKRVAGLPMERLEIRSGKILINGLPLSDPGVFTQVEYVNAGYASPGVVLAMDEDSFFVVGDNSADSYDSRFWGAVRSGEILGKAALIVWPPHRFGPVPEK